MRIVSQAGGRAEAPASEARVLVDARPLQSADSVRGIGTYVRGLLSGLIEAGFDDRTALLVDSALPAPELPASQFIAYGFRRRFGGRLGILEEATTVGSRLERIRPALYHATTLALPARSPVPVVATLHDLIPWALGGRAMRGERLRWWPGRRLLRRTNLVLAVSEATAADARRLARVSSSRILVVPEGLAPGFRPAAGAAERVRARHQLQRPYLLYVGSLDARKEPGSLLRAWAVARAAGADVDLVLAGAPGVQAPAHMGEARRLGYLEHSELVDLYSAAACLVFPSRYEGFGLPLLEAMGCGCPVVAYRNSSLPEVADGAAVLVDDGDAEALGRAAAEIVMQPARAAELRRRGLARARRFTWRRTAEETIAAYEAVMASGPNRD